MHPTQKPNKRRPQATGGLTRGEVTQLLAKAVIEHYAVKLTHGVYQELGLTRGGTLRADLYAVNLKGIYTLLETKSCWADLSGDSKLQHYLDYADRCYLVIPHKLWRTHKDKILGKIPKLYGVYILDSETGYLRCVRPAKQTQEFEDENRRGVTVRMLFRADWCAKNIKRNRRRKIYIE